MKTISGIYCILNSRTQYVYIGGSSHIFRRWYYHRTKLRAGKHGCPNLQKAWNAARAESDFSFWLLEPCNPSREVLDRHEQFWLDAFPHKYNSSPFASRSESAKWAALGHQHSLEQRKKIGDAHRGVPRPQHVREKISASHLGVKKGPHTAEAKTRIGDGVRKAFLRPEVREKVSSPAARKLKSERAKEMWRRRKEDA